MVNSEMVMHTQTGTVNISHYKPDHSFPLILYAVQILHAPNILIMHCKHFNVLHADVLHALCIL